MNCSWRRATLVRRWGPRSLADMRTFLGGLVVLPYDQRVSALRAGCRPTPSSTTGRGRSTTSWIAACCLVRDLPLGTFTIRDFTDFVEHEGLQLLPTS